MKGLFKKVLKRPGLVFLLVILAAVFAGAVIKYRYRMVTNLDDYMPKDHPAFVFSDEADERFLIREVILIALEHPDSVYNTGTLAKMIRLEEDLARFDEIEPEAIQSLHRADNILGTEEGLEVGPFYSEAPGEEDIPRIRDAVRSNDMVKGRLVSKDEKTALIIVELPDRAYTRNFHGRLLDLTASYEGPEKLYLAGRPIVEGTMAVLGPRDMARMGPLVILVIALVLIVVLRSFVRMLITLGVVVAAVLGSFALMTGLGIPIYTLTIMVPVMLIAIGVAYGIHLYNQIDYYALSHPEADRREVAENVIDTIWSPVLFAALTTMAGFASLVTSEVYPVKYFGIFSAVGVAGALILSMLLIPAGVVLFGIGGRSGKNTTRMGPAAKPPFGERFADGVLRRPALVISGAVLVLGLSLFGISRVWINTSFLSNFEKDSDIVKTDALVNAGFGGTSSLNVILDSGTPDAFKDPALLELMRDAQEGALGLEKAGDAISIVDYLKRMNRVMNGDRAEYDRIPESSDLVAQYLLLYEMSGDPANLWKVVDSDYSGANLRVQLKSDDSRTIKGVTDYFDTRTEEFARHGVEVRYAGSGYKSMVFADLILKGQISSLGLSVLIVIGLVSLMFRSLRFGLFAGIPVAVAIAVNFGIMGLLGIPLTSSTALISSIAVGIGVDYAIHFLERYRETLKETKDPVYAGRFSMSLTGRAVFLNAAIVISGFMVLLFSVFPPNRQVGALVSLNMLTAFAATVTIMFLVLRKT